MKLWPFSKNRPKPTGRRTVPYPPEIVELPVLKHHALRALCGALMDRHSKCQSPHPFCFPYPLPKEARQELTLIAEVALQTGISEDETQTENVIGIYLTRAEFNLDALGRQPETPFDYAANLSFWDPVPTIKLVVRMLRDGTYFAQCGEIANPVEGDYSTGALDLTDVRTLYCDPEPKYASWEYFDSKISASQQVSVVQFRCLMHNGYWTVVDVGNVGKYVEMSQVARLRVADNPDHNFGILSLANTTLVVKYDGSEYSKAVQENLPRVFL